VSDATEQADGNDTYEALYGRSVRGSVAREGKYTRARALSRDTSPSSKRLPR
jgi:hypothetical protein